MKKAIVAAGAVAALAAAAVVGRNTAAPPELPTCSTRDGERLVDLGRHAPDECLAVVLGWRRAQAGKDAGR